MEEEGIYGMSGTKIKEEFSEAGQGAGVRENKGWDHWEGFERWERKGHLMGVLKGWKAGEKRENCPALLKICNRKMAK